MQKRRISKFYFLTALLLALWLPTQALATALLHCVTTDAITIHSAAMPSGEHSKPSDDADDCHGQTMAQQKSQTTASNAEAQAQPASSPDCYHCTGGCHKLQQMMALANQPLSYVIEATATVNRPDGLAAGFPDYPIRPPRNIPLL